MTTAARRRRQQPAAAVVAGALAPAVLLAVDPAGWYPFGPVKWLLASTLVFAATALAGHRVLWRAHPGLTRASVVLVLAMVVAATLGVDPVLAWIGTPDRNAGVAFWVVCALALLVGQQITGADDDGQPAQVPQPVRVGVVVAAGGVAVVGVAEALGWEPALLDVGSRLTGTMGSSAYLGAVSVFLLPVVIGLGWAAPSTAASAPARRRWMTPVAAAALAAGAGLVVVVIGSGARAAWVGLAVAGALLVLANRSWIRSHRRTAGIGVGLALVAALTVLVWSPAGARLGSLADDGAPGGRGRLDEWRVATRVLAHHPLTGVGPEGYRIAFHEGVDRGYEVRHGRDPLPDRAHSAPLDVALAGGPVAFGAWAWIWAVVVRSAWQAMRSPRPAVVGLAVGVVAHGVGQLFLFPLAELEPVVWLLAGILVATQAGTDAAAAPAVSPQRPSVRRVVTGAAVAGAAVAFVAGSLAVAAARRAERAATTGSVAAAEAAVGIRPDHLRLHLLEARLRVLAGEGVHTAVEAVRRGREWSPDDPVLRRAEAGYLVDRALATEVPAHADEARSFVWRALAIDPLDSELWARAAVLAALDG